MKPQQIKIHALDRTKSSYHCRIGTKCGIRLKQHGAAYYAERVGTLQFTALRLVEEFWAGKANSGVVTCKSCLNVIKGRFGRDNT